MSDERTQAQPQSPKKPVTKMAVFIGEQGLKITGATPYTEEELVEILNGNNPAHVKHTPDGDLIVKVETVPYEKQNREETCYFNLAHIVSYAILTVPVEGLIKLVEPEIPSDILSRGH